MEELLIIILPKNEQILYNYKEILSAEYPTHTVSFS
jgi:hypothetical protein